MARSIRMTQLSPDDLRRFAINAPAAVARRGGGIELGAGGLRHIRHRDRHPVHRRRPLAHAPQVGRPDRGDADRGAGMDGEVRPAELGGGVQQKRDHLGNLHGAGRGERHVASHQLNADDWPRVLAIGDVALS